VLSSMDDYPIHQIAAPILHVGTSDRNFYDRYYFNLHGSTDELFMSSGWASTRISQRRTRSLACAPMTSSACCARRRSWAIVWTRLSVRSVSRWSNPCVASG